jgi:Flp pilus assembly protein TadD
LRVSGWRERNQPKLACSRKEKSGMRVRIMKAGVLCAALAALFLILRFAPAPQTSRPPSKTAGSGADAIPTTIPSEKPGKDQHDLKVLEMALRKKPGHTPVLMQLAKLEEEKGNLEKAAEHLQEIVKKEPGNLAAELELGRVLYQRGNIQGALEHTQAILKVQPNNADALYNLGAIYGNLGNVKLAREYWGRLISIDPRSESGKRAQQTMAQLSTASQ